MHAKGFKWPSSLREPDGYHDELARQVESKIKLPETPTRQGTEKYFTPSNAREVWVRDVIRTHPRALWIEGCEGPRVNNFQVRLRIKPDAVPKASQPFPLGGFDQLRVDFRVEEEAALGKRVFYDPKVHELPEWLPALFVVDQKNKGLLGIMVTAYGYVNDNTVTAASAVPAASATSW